MIIPPKCNTLNIFLLNCILFLKIIPAICEDYLNSFHPLQHASSHPHFDEHSLNPLAINENINMNQKQDR